jgi:hypothetical protein
LRKPLQINGRGDRLSLSEGATFELFHGAAVAAGKSKATTTAAASTIEQVKIIQFNNDGNFV